MSWNSGLKGKLNIKGAFQFRDKDGNVLSTMEVDGSIPLDRFTPEQQQQLLKDIPHATDNR